MPCCDVVLTLECRSLNGMTVFRNLYDNLDMIYQKYILIHYSQSVYKLCYSMSYCIWQTRYTEPRCIKLRWH